MLVRADLRPRAKPPRGNWKDICNHSLELLQRCVYLDKDLVLPPIAAPGPEQSFFVIASTDLARVEIMMARIRGQMDKLEELRTAGEFEVSAEVLPLADLPQRPTLEAEVNDVAGRVTEMVRVAMAPAKAAIRQVVS